MFMYVYTCVPGMWLMNEWVLKATFVGRIKKNEEANNN